MHFNPENAIRRLARAQMAHPLRFLACAAILTALAGVYAAGLKFDSSYEALLPVGAPEVKNLDDIRARTGGVRQLVIAIGGGDEQKRLRFGRRIAPALKKIDNVRFVDVELPTAFFADRALWMADIGTLDRLIPALEDAMRIAREQANPLALHLDEEAEKKQLAAAWKKVEAIAEEGKPGMAATLGTRDGRWNFVIVVPSIKFSDMGKGQALVNRVKSVVERANPAAAGLRVKYAGALEILMEQHRVMSMDMVKATIISILFGVLIVAGVTRRIHAPFYIATSLLIGIVWTFAVARLLVGHVNIITGFLVSVLIGLGIDFGIHLYMRFVQEARAKDASPEDVFVAFITGTITPAMTAAATTAAVFFTFTIADFRGFSEFGLIAGIGVIFTLISTFLVFPPLIALFEQRRIADIARRAPDDKALRGRRIPLSASIAIIAALSIPAVCGIFGAIHMPFRNDFRQLRGYSDATAFSDYVDRHLGAGFNPAVFVADSIDDARRIGSRLRKAHEKDATRDIPVRVGRVLAASDLVPADVDAHRQRIEKIAQIVNAPSLNRAAEQETPQGEKLRNARKMVTTGPWTLDEVPVEFRRRFQTIDQPVGYLVYAWSAGPHDADYLAAAWEDRLKGISRSLRADGVSHAMADETHILSWVYRLVRKDALPLLLISALSVIGLVALDFRNLRDTVLLVLTLACGMLLFIGTAWLLGLEINMFNMIIFPSVIGIGIDNAVHILHRYHREGPGSVLFVVQNTGQAALLASTTTLVGFGAAIVAHNLGLRSMGIMAIIGISATFVAAVVLMPCILTILEARRRP